MSDENDSTRILTRAKAAALKPEDASMPVKGALQPKKSAVNANNAGTQRSRAALGDVSNVGKANVTEGKKAASGKVGLVSKAAHPTGVQKTRPASRAALTTKATNASENKRTGSGAGAIAGPKRKVASSAVSRDENSVEPAEPPERRHTLPLRASVFALKQSRQRQSRHRPRLRSPKPHQLQSRTTTKSSHLTWTRKILMIL